MRLVHADYNMYHNSIDITTFEGYILRIDCNKAEASFTDTLCATYVITFYSSLRFNSSQQGVTKSFITRHISASRQIDCLLISEGATASNTFRQA